MRIGITGGTGSLGRALAHALGDSGAEIVIFSRHRRPVAGATVRRWDPTGEPMSPDHLGVLDAVVHLAGEPLVAGRWTAARKRRIVASRVTGTENLVARWGELDPPPRILLSGSAIGFYGNRGDEVLDETSSTQSGFLGDLSAAWEAAAGAVTEAGTRLVHLRTGLVLTRGDGMLGTMLLPFRLGLGGRLGSGRQWMSWIHVEDWVGLVRHALATPEIAGPLNLVAPTPVTNAAFTRTLARVLGRPALLPVPAFALRLIFGDMAGAMLGSQRVVPAKAEQHRYRYRFEALEPALRDLIET